MKILNPLKYLSAKQLMAIVSILVITVLLAFMLLRKPAVISSETTNAVDHKKSAITEKTENHADEVELITLNDEQLKNADLQIATVSSAKIASQLTLPGELKLNTDQESHVSSPFAGRVETVHVTTGQQVKQGQILASLLIPQLVELQGNLTSARSRLALTQSSYEREKKLWQQGISAKQDYLQAENNWQLAKIEVNAAQQGLRAYGASTTDQSGRLTITAPTSGTVVAKDLTIGETILSSNQLFTIAKLDALWVEFSVPPILAGQLFPGMTLEVLTNTNQPAMSARLLTYTPSADSKTRNLIARARLENSARNLRPNMLVTVRMQGETQTAPIAVDSRALQTIKDKTVVFVETNINGKRSYQAQPVILGSLSDNHLTAISQGLAVGMRYVTVGSFILKSELEKSEAGHDH